MAGARQGGVKFETDIIVKKGWTKQEQKLRFLDKSEHGVSNVFGIFHKYQNDLGGITLCESHSLRKYDAIQEDGTPIEIKKTSIKSLLKERGILYGEPFSKIGDQGRALSRYFHDGYTTWNNIVRSLEKMVMSSLYWKNILISMDSYMCDIYTPKGLIPSKHLELFWYLSGRVHLRLVINTRIKSKYRGLYI